MNHSDVPLHAASVYFDLEELGQIGIKTGYPFEAVTETGEVLPLMRVIENSVVGTRLYLSLQGGERVDFTLRSAEKWGHIGQVASASFDAGRGTGTLRNGILAFHYRSGKWGIDFSPPRADEVEPPGNLSVLADCHMDFWLDSERRGRQLGIAPERLNEMGLISSERMILLGGESRVLPDGSAVLELTKGFDGFASDITWTETYTLPPGKPILLYRSRFTTTSAAERYIAFVDLGGGVRGRFGELLQGKMRFKYENPKEPDRILLSGRENSFLRVAWRADRCWVGIDSELGYGVGISTTDSITRPLQGSTVWRISNSDFLARVLCADQENQPYSFSAGNPLDFGFAFLATAGGADIWEESRQLFSSVTQGNMPRTNSTYGVYSKAHPFRAGRVNSFHADLATLSRLPGTGPIRVAALEMNFTRPHILSATASNENGFNQVSVNMIPWGESGETRTLMTLKPGEKKEIDLTETTGWLGQRRKFILEVSQSQGLGLEQLTITPAGFEAPKLDVPADGVELTHIATYFRWKQIKGALDYEIQLARDERFTDTLTLKVRSEVDKPYYMPSESELPSAGLWYWRVRAVESDTPGQWSDSRSFSINTDLARSPLVFKPTPEHPLFTMEGNRVLDWSRFKDTLPSDIKSYVAINTSIYKNEDYISYFRPMHEEMGVKVFLRTHGPGPMSHWVPLSIVEEIFQTYPNVIGIMGGETLSALYHGGDMEAYMQRLLQLCGKYGRIFYEADGSYPRENKFQALYENKSGLMEAYKDHLIFAQKNNILHRQFVTQSSVLGLYLAGDIVAQGAWEDGGWYWQQVGFRKLGERFGQRGGTTEMPRNFWNLNFLMGLARGTTVFSFEGQTGTTPVSPGWSLTENGRPPQFNPTAYWTTEGELTDSFKRFCLPFIRAVVKQGLVPTGEQVLENIELAVYNDGLPRKDDGDHYYYEWESLYRGTYGFRDLDGYPGTLMEFFPNTGRYFYIPVLPQGKVELGHGIQTLPLSQLTDTDGVRRRFNAAYPEWYTGDALVSLTGDTLAVLNSNENLDEAQAYSAQLKERGVFRRISGTVTPHAYVMGKFKDGNQRLWLQAHTEYPGRETKLTLIMDSAPAVTITPANAAQLNLWDKNARTLSLVLSHAEGPVEVTIDKKSE